MNPEFDPLGYVFNKAFQDGDETEMRLLVEAHGINVELFGGQFPMHCAAANCKNVRMLDELLTLGADINAGTSENMTPLHVAAMNANIVALVWLLDQGVDPNIHTDDFWTPLHGAAYDAEATEILLKYGAHPNGVSDASDNAPLHEAALSCVECIHLLIAYGADINRPDKYGDPPIAYAIGSAWASEPVRWENVPLAEAKALFQYEHLMKIDDPKLQEAINKFKSYYCLI